MRAVRSLRQKVFVKKMYASTQCCKHGYVVSAGSVAVGLLSRAGGGF